MRFKQVDWSTQRRGRFEPPFGVSILYICYVMYEHLRQRQNSANLKIKYKVNKKQVCDSPLHADDLDFMLVILALSISVVLFLMTHTSALIQVDSIL